MVDSLVPNLVDVNSNDALVKVPNIEEVYQIVLGMDSNSAARSDGFGGIFYKVCWDIIKANLYMAVQWFFPGHQLPTSWTSTLVVTIPKVDCSKTFEDLRSISLCNFSVKILLRIISNRLALLLPSLISLEHSGFTQFRSITDNVMLQKLPSKVRGDNVVLKLDLAKAYDRVPWLFITKVLRKFGFGERFIDLVWRIISNCWYLIIINGQREDFFSIISWS